ncbi:MAG: alkaline phosphatase D family protein [Planctomycetaceae bacterium]|nr:alkaline phosphatase D family protein [Planctomycetaceae bacterium]
MRCLPLLILGALAVPTLAAEFTSDWHLQPDRIWIGPQYWANPMEDWRIHNGRLECMSPDSNRNVHLLGHRLGEDDGTFEMSVTVGLQDGSEGEGSVGFEIGIQSELGDCRSSVLRGLGQRVVMTSEAEVKVGGGNLFPATINFARQDDLARRLASTGLRLKWFLDGDTDSRELVFRIHDPETDELLTVAGRGTLHQDRLAGNIALVHNPTWLAEPGKPNSRGPRRQSAKFWFRDLKVTGTKLVETPEHEFGPILYAMHTLSRGVMTMTAQLPPIGSEDDQVVRLQVPVEAAQAILRVPNVATLSEISNLKSEILDADPQPSWTNVARSTIDPLSRTAHFRMKHWLDTEDVPYRLVYTMRTTNGELTDHFYTGTVRRDPVDKPSISVAGFTGHKDTAFPNELLVSNVLKHDPDVLLFTGDQIYEDAGGFGIIRNNTERGVLNYLRKIYLWGWSFRDVLRDRPSFVLPDDHDVYQGNVWGQGGNATKEGMKDHDAGGFAEPPDFVNAVFRTQVAHHPPVYDDTPMMQGIDCWYGDAVYGRISFAIIEDRYFKSGPRDKVNEWPGRPDHVKDANYDVTKLDQPGLVLLGERQLDFLDAWSQDWTGADMKCACSQTIFCNLANYHGPEQEFIYADLDSNGWPQTGRNKAVAAMRKGFAFHYAGDQHLPSIVHHGIETWNDAGWSFCVPSTAAGYPRSWRPDAEGRPVQNRPAPGLANTGEYRDAFGHPITVHAIGNPAKENRKPVLELLHDKSSGYGLVHFNKPDRTITMECWKLLIDADNPQPDDQFPGWPKTIHMLDNDGREPVAYLPRIEVNGSVDPVVQIIDQESEETVYTLRIPGTSFRPKVYSSGRYMIRVSDTDRQITRTIENVQSDTKDASESLQVRFP